MIEIILVVAAVAFASFIAFNAIPRIAQRAALYDAHHARDKFYCAFSSPEAKNTAVYRDLEFLFSSVIFVLRDQSAVLAGAWGWMIRRRPREAKRPDSPQVVRYAHELKQLFRDRAAMMAVDREVEAAMEIARQALLLRVVSASPVLWLAWPFVIGRRLRLEFGVDNTTATVAASAKVPEAARAAVRGADARAAAPKWVEITERHQLSAA